MMLLLNRGDQVDAMLAEFYNSKFNVGSVCPVLAWQDICIITLD